MNKLVVLIFLSLSLSSCKQIKVIKAPDPKCASSEEVINGKCQESLILCTGEVDAEGVLEARKSSKPGSKCVILSCEGQYEKINFKAFIDTILAQGEGCGAQGACSMMSAPYIPPEVLEFADKYPYFCAPKELPCEGETFGEGVIRFLGLPSLVDQEMTDGPDDELPPLDYLIPGYGFCEPKDQNSCDEGYIFISDLLYYNGEMHVYNDCVEEYLDCTDYLNEYTSGGVEEARMPYDAQEGGYSYDQCVIISCQEGRNLVDNECVEPQD